MSPARSRRSRPVRAVTAAALAVPAVAILLAPVPAGAAVTTTAVTSPDDGSVVEGPHPALQGAPLSGPAPGLLTVRGVAPGAADGDEVVLVCEQRFDGATFLTPLQRTLPVLGGDEAPAERTAVRAGAFEADVVAPDVACRIRALPPELAPDGAGTDARAADLDLDAFGGPRVLGGASYRLGGLDGTFGGAVLGGAERSADRGYVHGTTLAFAARTGPVGLGLTSASGGLVKTAILDGARVREVFGPSGAAGGFGYRADGDGPPVAYFGLLVDDRPADVTPVLGDGTGATTAVRTVDPDTGAQTVVETAPVALIDRETPGGVGGSSGLVLERTSRQERDGRRYRISDVYRSIDGAPHRLDVRYSAAVGGDPYGVANEVAPPTFRVPWGTGDAYVPGVADQPIGPAPAGRATVWVTAPEHDYSGLVPVPRADAGAPAQPAYGAITYDPAPVEGTYLGPNAFVLRFERAIPAGCSATIEQVFAQDWTRPGVEELVRELDPQPGPAFDCGAPPDPASPGPATAPPPAPAQTGPVPAPPVAPRTPTTLDPLPRLASAVRLLLADRRQAGRFRAARSLAVTVPGIVPGRYGVTLRRDVGRGRGLRTIATGVRTVARGGTLRVTVRPTRYGRSYLAGLRRAGRTSVRLRVIVTWTPPGDGRRRREAVRTVTPR